MNFGKIPSLFLELAALERLRNNDNSSAFVFDWIFFILAGYKDNHKVSNGFEIRPDQTLDCGVSFSWASEKIPIDL